MNYAHIQRTHTDFKAPALMPNAAHYLHSYGHLIQSNERIRLDEFAARIEAHYNSLRSMIEAGEIRRWFDLMLYAEDSVMKTGTLPSEFHWEDGHYDKGDCLAILGDAAIAYLQSDRAA